MPLSTGEKLGPYEILPRSGQAVWAKCTRPTTRAWIAQCLPRRSAPLFRNKSYRARAAARRGSSRARWRVRESVERLVLFRRHPGAVAAGRRPCFTARSQMSTPSAGRHRTARSASHAHGQRVAPVRGRSAHEAPRRAVGGQARSPIRTPAVAATDDGRRGRERAAGIGVRAERD